MSFLSFFSCLSLPGVKEIASAISIFTFLKGVFSEKVYVKRVESSVDIDVEQVSNLYIKLFPDKTIDYDVDELNSFFDKLDEPRGNRHIAAKDYLLVAKFRKNVVGFMFFHYYPSRKKCIISYLGTTAGNEATKVSATQKLFEKMSVLLDSEVTNCEYVFFDVDRPSQDVGMREDKKRRARITLFLRSAKRCKKKAYILNFDYNAPKVTMDGASKVRPLVLMVVPISGVIPVRIQKGKVLEFLRFMYFDCYGDHYRKDDPIFPAYQSHLCELIEGYEKMLPDDVEVTSRVGQVYLG